MKYRVVEYTNRGSENFRYHVQQRIFLIKWQTVDKYSKLEEALDYIERKRRWNEKKIWYSPDPLMNAMKKVKEGDKS